MKIIPTNKTLTFNSLMNSCTTGCEINGFFNFTNWYRRQGYGTFDTKIYFGGKHLFDKYLDNHEDLKQWLVEKGFAKVREAKLKLPLYLKGKETNNIWALIKNPDNRYQWVNLTHSIIGFINYKTIEEATCDLEKELLKEYPEG